MNAATSSVQISLGITQRETDVSLALPLLNPS